MKKIYLLGLAILASLNISLAQHEGFPKGMTEEEFRFLQTNGGLDLSSINRGIETPPDFPNIRTMAEWEEIQSLSIAWIFYPGILKQITRASQAECQVIILAENPSEVENYLLGNAAGGPLENLDNIEIIEADFNSIWMRDYAGNSVYGNEVDDLFMVDWIYNRPQRPDDDASPEIIADFLNLDLYTTTAAPNDLVNTGGNFMSDGFGTAFASELILEENEPGNFYGVTPKTEEDVDQIMSDFMGIDRYIKMTALEFDNINHIDMHMKIINEHTLLVGEYPPGIADGPQINANIEYVLSNFNSKFDEPYDVVRIPMPNSPSGLWPDDNPAGYYRTYTNAVFVNNTILLPTYREEFDTTAFRIYSEILPGYNVVGIDCDDQPEQIIAQSGAIHCITHSVGVEDPLLISHQALPDTEDQLNDYEVEAYVNHRSGISEVSLWYRTDEGSAYSEVIMQNIGGNDWSGNIPAQPGGTIIDYYIHAVANSGKEQDRPMPAPEGYYRFRVLGETVDISELNTGLKLEVFPNPANAITCIPVELPRSARGSISLYDVTGKKVEDIFSGTLPLGESKYFIDASRYQSGAYVIVLETEQFRRSQRLMIK